jgi:alpha-glucosidase (family GH31 glycosyl hydrolase)
VDGLSGPAGLQNGLLDRRGWYLLDDAKTAFWAPGVWPQPRAAHGGTYQDGYFFGYAHDYQLGLRELAQLTGPAPLLPRSVFGTWFSRYFAYSATDYQSLLNTFRTEKVPLDVLVVDTDFKAPSAWDGWSWNTSLFPDPTGFMNWASQNGLKVTLNIHPAIDTNDSHFNTANATAGGLIGTGVTRFFDWGNSNHVRAYFDLHTPFNNQGVSFWWLDWCCDASISNMAGITPDAWINEEYAKNTNDRGLRGFAMSRMGGSQNNAPSPSGPWAEHRNTLHFTGDSWVSWSFLQFAAKMTIREGNLGIPYVSHDLGTHNGEVLADDYFMRWMQLGTFQPIFRPHSNHGLRLPWDYPNVKASAENFWRLRAALVPYTYSLAREATQNGLPIVRGLYLYNPENNEAYTFDSEYLFGSKMLVAPIVTPGANASVSVWFPPGTWTDYFTGQTHTGPSVQSVSATYDTFPVFVKAGGIVPLAPYMDYTSQKPVDPLTVRVFTGADGDFSVYEDAGEGQGYKTGAYRFTPLNYTNSSRTLQIGAAQGTYPGALTQRAYDLELNGVTTLLSGVSVNGTALNQITPGTGEGWWYSSAAARLNVHLNARSTASALTITYTPASNLTGVIFYQDANFGGVTSGIKGLGDYPVMPADVPNDWMSSVRVPAGWIIDAYVNGNFGGAVCSFSADTSFVGATCNDVMSSFKVRLR